MLLDKLDDQPQRDWYADAAATHGWSRNVLQLMKAATTGRRRTLQLHGSASTRGQRTGSALTRDCYVLDFLDLTSPVRKRDLEDALVQRVQALLLERWEGLAVLGVEDRHGARESELLRLSARTVNDRSVVPH